MTQPVRTAPVPWNALEVGMTVVGKADSLWDVVEATIDHVRTRGRATGREMTVETAIAQRKGDARVLRGPELSRIMRTRIGNAEGVLRDKLGAVRADLGLNDGKNSGMICSDMFRSGEDLASHLFIMHGEYARKSGVDADNEEYRTEMWEFHQDLHKDVRPIDSPGLVPHIHDASQRGKGMRHVKGESAE